MASAVKGNSEFNKVKQFLRTNWKSLLVVAIGILLMQDIFGTHGVLAMRRSQKEAAEIRSQIKQLNYENCRLTERAKDLQSDPATIEKIAREKLGLAGKNEVIFKVAPKPGDPKEDLTEIELHADATQKCDQAK